MQDVTETVRARERLEEREALVRGLFDTMPGGCVVHEVRGTGRSGSDYIVKDMNLASLAAGRCRLEEAVGKTLEDRMRQVADHGLVDVFWRVWRTGDPE